MTVATAPRGRGRLHGIPPQWRFESRTDDVCRCPHPHHEVEILGNVDKYKIWRCHRCRTDVVPVAPGWRWNRRRRSHEPADRDRVRAEAGHAYAYMDRL